MPYPEPLVQPMRAELTRLGVEELRDAASVDAFMEAAQTGTALVVVNSVCGCAAANARPAVALARQASVQPDRYATVFAGQDLEATAHLRDRYLKGIPPSSPFMALFQDGEPVFVIERSRIEGRSASAIASDLAAAFEGVASGRPAGAGGDGASATGEDDLPETFRSIL